MKICAYVPDQYVKQNYKKESYNTRKNAGMQVVIDILRRAGHEVDFASSTSVNRYDYVLVSLTADCDWWGFIRERVKWPAGDYKVIAGGAGVLNVRPFLPYADYFVLGRAEGVIDRLVDGSYDGDSVIESKTFSVEGEYVINQADNPYPYSIKLEDGSGYMEDQIGCNHRCLFCGYTWHRKRSGADQFQYGGLWSKNADVERAMIDLFNGMDVDLNRLRTTSIDGMSYRLRKAVHKDITREMVQWFIRESTICEKPHQIKYYNIIGYPGETEDDWYELLDDIVTVDSKLPKLDKQSAGILLHSTPFRAMPATPLACKPMSYKNYRKAVANILGKGLKGNIFYQGNSMYAVESMGTESLPTVIQSAICHRGTEDDIDNVRKLACSDKFLRADSKTKQITLERYFDVDTLFGSFVPETLPSRYLKTYAKVEKMWS